MNDRAPVSRRALLVAGGAVIAGGAGAAAGWFSTHDRAPAPPPPAPRAPVLEAEFARETALLARYDATSAPPAETATLFVGLQSDHAAHVEALRALLAELGVDPSTSNGAGTSASAAGTGSSSAAATPALPFSVVGDLVAAETTAARASAAASLQSAGAAAATLASMSACESTHAALLA